MGFADYLQRNAVAVSQLVPRFSEEAFRDRLLGTRVGLIFGIEAVSSQEGNWLLDMVVRLLARLYPALMISGPATGIGVESNLRELALRINPHIEFCDSADLVIGVGSDVPRVADRMVYAGCDDFVARVSSQAPRSVGKSSNPLGSGAAACFACADVFRQVFLEEHLAEHDLQFSTWLGADGSLSTVDVRNHLTNVELVVAGLGAIGNAAVWALAKLPLSGCAHLVDHQSIELGNLQRYVLSARNSEGRAKVALASEFLNGNLVPVLHDCTWEEFVSTTGYVWSHVLVGLDSAAGRKSVQASLPKWVANAWTQPGDLGVSSHEFLGEGACLYCLYLASGPVDNEDAIIAKALQVPDLLMQIRLLLHSNAGLPRDLLEIIAKRMDLPLDKVMEFEGEPVKKLYVDGLCGGALVPLGQAGAPRREVHVPVAHQSALAGILLAASFIAKLAGRRANMSTVTRINLMKPLTQFTQLPAAKDFRGICICQDEDYVVTYERKYPVVAD